MKSIVSFLPVVMILMALSANLHAAPMDFHHAFEPLVAQYCLACHDEHGALETGLDIEALDTESRLRDDLPAMKGMLKRLESGSMPPAETDQPSETERKQLIEYLEQAIIAESGV